MEVTKREANLLRGKPVQEEKDKAEEDVPGKLGHLPATQAAGRALGKEKADGGNHLHLK